MYTDAPLQSFEMGYSRKEFDGVLGLQQGIRFQTQSKNAYQLFWQDQPVIVELGTEKMRRIASMTMSQLPITMDLTALPQDQRKPFLKVFFQSFLKGGG